MAENAERCWAEHKMLPFDCRHSDPSRREDASELAMREEYDVASHPLKFRNQPARAEGNLRGRLAAGATVTKQIPIRTFLAKVCRELTFIGAIVPLGEVRFNLGGRRKSRQLACPPGPLQRTCQDVRELDRPKARFKAARLVFAMRGQRNIGAASVLARQRPSGFAVPDEI